MNNLISVKSDLNKNINDILSIINDIDLKDNLIIQELTNKNKILNEANIKFLEEIKAKDKILGMNQKTICDYEKQINSLNEVKEEDNKFGMLKAKDKEVNNLNKTVESLKKELELVNSKLEMVTTTNVTCEVVDDPVDEPVEESVEDPVVVENDTESVEAVENRLVRMITEDRDYNEKLSICRNAVIAYFASSL